MVLNPLRLLRRMERLRREALDEAQMLKRRYGDGACEAARAKLARPDLTTWHRQVMERTIKLLESNQL